MIRAIPVLAPLALAATLALPACGPVAMTTDSMRGQCWSVSDPDCFNLCDDYRDMLDTGKFTNRKDCREACTDIFKRQAADNAINRCAQSAAGGVDLCNQYCNLHHDK